MNSDQGYRLLAGKCQTICEAIAVAHPEFRLVRGHYFCPMWNRDRGHWWLECDGVVYDPTRDQFPSKGSGVYTEFRGMVSCAECGKQVKEDDAEIEGNYAFCSSLCHGRFVGVY